MRDEIIQYQRAGVRPFGVNPADATSHAAYARRLNLPFPLLADNGLMISRAYGAVRPDEGAVARSVVLIDRDGTVLFAQPGAPGASISLESFSPEG